MKSSVALLATLLSLATGLNLIAQGHAVGLPTGDYANTGIGTTSKNAGAGQPTDTTPTNVEGDDSVVRLNTQQSLAGGAMSRDDGQLTFKRRAKENVSEVNSTKELKSSRTDSKFQGSLLHSSVTSIDDVSTKTSQEGEGQALASEQPLRHKIFTSENGDESKKDETHTKAESSPSPSPSPSVSPRESHR
jgi:hypothetical protein